SPAPQGSQVAFLQGTGSLSQTVYFKAGTYSLSFLGVQRNQQQGSSQTVQVLIDGTPVGPADGFKPGTSYSAHTTDSFTLKAGYHTITLIGLNAKSGDNTAFIDLVSVQPAPTAVPALPMPPDPASGSATRTGPTADPILAQVATQRSRQGGQLLGATLTFNVPVNLDPRALRLVQRRKGGRVRDLSKWIRIVMVVQDG